MQNRAEQRRCGWQAGFGEAKGEEICRDEVNDGEADAELGEIGFD